MGVWVCECAGEEGLGCGARGGGEGEGVQMISLIFQPVVFACVCVCLCVCLCIFLCARACNWLYLCARK